MAVINTNVKALFSQAALTTSGRAQALAMQQLSTGKRINSARDDAAGMAIATRMTQQIRGLNQAVRNAGDAITLIQTAEGATNEISDMMQRMRELAVQAVNDTNDNAQRSYLDLEFQQLKQQIVQISNNTEWNGFPVLTGTAGQQVGEMPVYKATSLNQSGPVFISPTTSRTIAGSDAGQQSTFTITPASFANLQTGNISIAGQTINIAQADLGTNNPPGTFAGLMTKIQTTLQNTPFFNANTGRSVAVDTATGQVTLTYNNTDGAVDHATVAPTFNLTGLEISAGGVTDVRTISASAEENFSNNGKFLQTGSLNIQVLKSGIPPTINANFLTTDNKSISLTVDATSDFAHGVVRFRSTADATSGMNSTVITNDLTYTLKDPQGITVDLTDATKIPATANVDGSPRINLSVDVAGAIPTLRPGDLKINDVLIGQSMAKDDTLSPPANAAGSAIAKAAAINRMAVDQGISQGESQSITFSGTPSPGTITVGGVSVVITAADTMPQDVAKKIAVALQASSQFGQGTDRTVSYASGSAVVNVNFPAKEGPVTAVSVEPGSTGLSGVVNTTAKFTNTVPGTGVFAKVNENIVTGKAMKGASVVSGAIFVNGYASGDITTVLNNPQATRQNVVRAINLISDKTGVKAIDTGSDAKGVTLVAVDGRNIEVRFETNADVNVFGDRVGLREGVQSSTISLESKIQAPIVLSASDTGDISRVGFDAGNYSKNQAVLNTKPRLPVGPAIAQVESVKFTGTGLTNTDSASLVINGVKINSLPAVGLTGQAIRDDFVNQINTNPAYANIGVIASAGTSVGEILITARTPGVPFSMAASKATAATNLNLDARQLTPNSPAQVANLGMNNLVINGIDIRTSTAADDTFSNTIASSSNPASSAIAIAAAINDSTSLHGVRAQANPVVSQGVTTYTAQPTSGKQSLWVNGTKIDVNFIQGESQSSRCGKVAAAINQRAGESGVTAVDNGKGVTLQSDGRNMSVWFDASVPTLSAASFGLSKGGEVAQVSKIKIDGGSASGTPVASVSINGLTVSATLAGGESPSAVATALKDAIANHVDSNNNPDLSNISVVVDPSDASGATLLLTSNVPGTAFDIRGAKVDVPSGQTIGITTITANSAGHTDVSAIDLSSAYSSNVLGGMNASKNANTLYGTVKLISAAPMLPGTPGQDGLTPSTLNVSGAPIHIGVGTAGFADGSNFATLGFQEGSFGGRASENMDPPKVGRMAFQVGSSANQVVTIDLADFGQNGTITGDITGDVNLAVDQRKVRINTSDGATAVLNLLDASMDKINATRANMGAVMNRLDHVVNNLTNVSMNMSTSRSQIEDADYASASTELAKTQIMQQAATAVLAQANTSQQTVLKLLGG